MPTQKEQKDHISGAKATQAPIKPSIQATIAHDNPHHQGLSTRHPHTATHHKQVQVHYPAGPGAPPLPPWPWPATCNSKPYHAYTNNCQPKTKGQVQLNGGENSPAKPTGQPWNDAWRAQTRMHATHERVQCRGHDEDGRTQHARRLSRSLWHEPPTLAAACRTAASAARCGGAQARRRGERTRTSQRGVGPDHKARSRRCFLSPAVGTNWWHHGRSLTRPLTAGSPSEGATDEPRPGH